MPATVSIIVPCYNEEATVGSLLAAIYGQTYPRDRMEVIVADGLSEDGTREAIARFRAAHPALEIRLIDNPGRSIPSALNRAILEARGEIIVRLDAHSVPEAEYVRRCVLALEAGKGANVGGVWDIRPGGPGWIAKGIALAASHPLGAGDASYRLKAGPRAVDTVPFGAFRRSLIETVGGFDETLLTNEDYEFNTRIRKTGGVVWIDPNIQSTYLARPNLRSLLHQYWRYGYWKARMLMRHPGSLRWRQAIPPLFVLLMLSLAALAPFLAEARNIFLGLVAAYVFVLLGVGIQLAIREREPRLASGTMLAFATMQIAWGVGFWIGFLSGSFKRHG